ncbi:MAG: plasmid stabilization protein [Methylocystis sp.]|uniref:FitA-like ribbon-helix-helix domain-containing protein n=1 Tax=Methylocystis sp. TaxID=1911079 RepID=UPI003D0DD91C
MAQLILKKMDDRLADRLQARAQAHGRSIEEEAQAILNEALGPIPRALPPSGLGARIMKRFEGIGLSEQEAANFELHGEEIQPAKFE